VTVREQADALTARGAAMRTLKGTVVAVVVVAMAGPTATAASVQPDPIGSDFDNDGIADLAIGVPFESLGSKGFVGAVQVLYGTPKGVKADGSRLFSQDSGGIADVAEQGDSFGFSLAPADFDGDGYDDLAVGAPGEDLGSNLDAGAVHVLYGSAAGLTTAGSQRFTQNTPGLADAIEGGDRFGTVAAGDVNGDGFADLVVGASEETVGDFEAAGALHVLFGSADGVTPTASLFLTQDTDGIEDEAYHLDRFGVAVAAGDVNSDGFDDLAVGANGEDLGPFCEPGSVCDAGAVHLLYGSADGTTTDGSLFLAQGMDGVRGTAENADLFGSAVAMGDVNGDGIDDLAIGAFAEDIETQDADEGSAHLLYGSAGGLSTDGDEYLTQNSPGMPDGAQFGDRFATALAVGDLDGDGFGDLAVGVPGEDPAGQAFAGMVQLVPGSVDGLVPAGTRNVTQGADGIRDVPEVEDQFGSSLAIANLGRGGRLDLAVGTLEGVGNVERAGAVAVLYGRADGAFGTGDQLWTQASPGIADAPGSGDFFGFPVAAA
jgi:hypothetical protein